MLRPLYRMPNYSGPYVISNLQKNLDYDTFAEKWLPVMDKRLAIFVAMLDVTQACIVVYFIVWYCYYCILLLYILYCL